MNEKDKLDNKQVRLFKTPIFIPLSVVIVIAIHFGYTAFFITSEETGFFLVLKNISFEVFLMCYLGIISIFLYNKLQLEKFLNEHPKIDNPMTLDKLKPIIRTNMYSALFAFLFLGLGSLTAIMTILNHGIVPSLIVTTISVSTVILIKWYAPVEESIKQIECTDELIEEELISILKCWLQKVFPNF